MIYKMIEISVAIFFFANCQLFETHNILEHKKILSYFNCIFRNQRLKIITILKKNVKFNFLTFYYVT